MAHRFELNKQAIYLDIDMKNERIVGNTNMNISLYMPIYYLYDQNDFEKNKFDIKNVKICTSTLYPKDEDTEIDGKNIDEFEDHDKAEKNINEYTTNEIINYTELDQVESYINFQKKKYIFLVIQIPNNAKQAKYYDIKINGKEKPNYYTIYDNPNYKQNIFENSEMEKDAPIYNCMPPNNHQNLTNETNINVMQNEQSSATSYDNDTLNEDINQYSKKIKKKKKKKKEKKKKKKWDNEENIYTYDINGKSIYTDKQYEDTYHDETNVNEHLYDDADYQLQNNIYNNVKNCDEKKRKHKSGSKINSIDNFDHNNSQGPEFKIVDFLSLDKFIEGNYMKGKNYLFIMIDNKIFDKEKKDNYEQFCNFCKNGETIQINNNNEYNVKINISVNLSFQFFNLNSYQNQIYFDKTKDILVTIKNYIKNNTWFPTIYQSYNNDVSTNKNTCAWKIKCIIDTPYFVISSNTLTNIYQKNGKNYFIYKTTNKASTLSPDQICLYAGNFNFLHLNDTKLKDTQNINYNFLYKNEKIHSENQSKEKNKNIYLSKNSTEIRNRNSTLNNNYNTNDLSLANPNNKHDTYNLSSYDSDSYFEWFSDSSSSNFSDKSDCEFVNEKKRRIQPDNFQATLPESAAVGQEKVESVENEKNEQNDESKMDTQKYYYEKVNNKRVPNIYAYTYVEKGEQSELSELTHSTTHTGYILKCFLEITKENIMYDNIIILFLPIHFTYLENYFHSEHIESSISSHNFDDIKNGYNLFSNSNMLNSKITDPYIYFKGGKYFIYGNVIIFSSQMLHNIYDILFNINVYSYKMIFAEGILSLCFNYYINDTNYQDCYFVYMLKSYILQKFIEQIFGIVEMNAILFELREKYCSLVELFGDVILSKQKLYYASSDYLYHRKSIYNNFTSTDYIFNNIYFIKSFLCIRAFFNILKNFNFSSNIHQYCFFILFSYFSTEKKIMDSELFWKKTLDECKQRYIESYKQIYKNKFKINKTDANINVKSLIGEEHEQYQIFEKYFTYFLNTYIKGYGIGQYILTFNIHLQRKGTSMDDFNFLISQNYINPFCFIDHNFKSNYFIADISSMCIYNLLELNKYIDLKNVLLQIDGYNNNIKFDREINFLKKIKNKIIITKKMKAYLDKIYFENFLQIPYPNNNLFNNIEKKILTFLKKKYYYYIDNFYNYPKHIFNKKMNKIISNFILKKAKKNIFDSFHIAPPKKSTTLSTINQFTHIKEEQAQIKSEKSYTEPYPNQAYPLSNTNQQDTNDYMAFPKVETIPTDALSKQETPHIKSEHKQRIIKTISKEKKRKKKESKRDRHHKKMRKTLHAKNKERKKRKHLERKKKKKKKRSKKKTGKKRKHHKYEYNEISQKHFKINKNYLLKKKKELINLPYTNFDSLDLVGRDGNFYLGFGYVGSDSLFFSTGKGNLYNNIIAYKKYMKCDVTKLSELCIDKQHIHQYDTSPFHTSSIYSYWKIIFRLYHYLMLLNKISKKKEFVIIESILSIKEKEVNILDPNYKHEVEYGQLQNFEQKQIDQSFTVESNSGIEPAYKFDDEEHQSAFNYSTNIMNNQTEIHYSNLDPYIQNNANSEQSFQDSHFEKQNNANMYDHNFSKYSEKKKMKKIKEKKERKKQREKERRKKEKIQNIKNILENDKKYSECYLNSYVSNNIPLSVDENKFFFCFLKLEIIEDDGIRVIKKNMLNNVVPFRFSVDARPEKGRKKVAFKYESLFAYKNNTTNSNILGNCDNKNMNNNNIGIHRNLKSFYDEPIDSNFNKTVKFIGSINDSDKYMIDYCKHKIMKRDKSLLCLDNRKLVAKICSKNKIPLLWIRVDNDFYIIGRIRRTQSVSMWIQQLLNDNNVLAQLESSFSLAFIPFFFLNKNITSNFNEGKNNYFMGPEKATNINNNSAHYGGLTNNITSMGSDGSDENINHLDADNILAHNTQNDNHTDVDANFLKFSSSKVKNKQRKKNNPQNNNNPTDPTNFPFNNIASNILAKSDQSFSMLNESYALDNDKNRKFGINTTNKNMQNDFLKVDKYSSQSSSSNVDSDSHDLNFTTSTIDDLNEDVNGLDNCNYSSSSYKTKEKKNYKTYSKKSISISNMPINIEVIKSLYKSITSEYLHYIVKIRCIYSLCFVHNKYIYTQKVIQNLFLEYFNQNFPKDLNQKKFMHAFFIALSLLRNKNNRTPKIILFLLIKKCSSFVLSLNLHNNYNLTKNITPHDQDNSASHRNISDRMGPDNGEHLGNNAKTNNFGKFYSHSNQENIQINTTGNVLKRESHKNSDMSELLSYNMQQANVTMQSSKNCLTKKKDEYWDYKKSIVQKISQITNHTKLCTCNKNIHKLCDFCKNDLNCSGKKKSVQYNQNKENQQKITYDADLIIQKEEEEDIKMVLECIGNIKFKNRFLFGNQNSKFSGIGEYRTNSATNINNISKNSNEYFFSQYFTKLISNANGMSVDNSYTNNYMKKRKKGKRKKVYHAYDFYDIDIYDEEKKIENHFLKLRKTKKEYTQDLIDLLFLIYELKKLSPYLPISDTIITILIRSVSRNKNILDLFRNKMYVENKYYFDMCEYLPNFIFQSKLVKFIEHKNANNFTIEVIRAILHLIMTGNIRIYKIYYKMNQLLGSGVNSIISSFKNNTLNENNLLDRLIKNEVSQDEANNFSNPYAKCESTTFTDINNENEKNENYFFVSTYTNFIERKVICMHLLNIYAAIQFISEIVKIFKNCEIEMLIWNIFYQLLLIFQQKYPFFFLPFSKLFNKYFKEYQKKSYTAFEFFYFLYGFNSINQYEKANKINDYNNVTDFEEDDNKMNIPYLNNQYKVNTNNKLACDYALRNLLFEETFTNYSSKIKEQNIIIYKYDIIGYISFIDILKFIPNTKKLKKNFIQITYIKYIVKYIHNYLRGLIIDTSNFNENYFKNSILHDLKNIFVFLYGYGIPPCYSKTISPIYFPHYKQLNDTTKKGVQINSLIKFLRTYYNNEKLLKWKVVASEFISVLTNMQELKLFVDDPTISLYNFNFTKENIWLSLISEKLENDIYKLPMDLKRDIILLLKNIRLVDICLGTNTYEHVNNIFTVCWFIIVKIFQNYEKSKKNV
ncbi:hypothetical protein YYG_03610 [Plasmodium vinckei petteri]|uniref:Uncharacterized protein n=1 Tax=Plasmodium vinckei petteri TaxID=138298 RepID=W7AQX3_PLAVN|nr:hypothetical protein YYG_03610 [Plasmodium vinckei petteri]CAD2100413.1 conserved Plasmodium protein, unknown function [Plasmodium vinckei petteri]